MEEVVLSSCGLVKADRGGVSVVLVVVTIMAVVRALVFVVTMTMMWWSCW